MNHGALIVSGGVLFVAAACAFVAVFATRVRRVFWIAGLSLASLELAGATIGVAFLGISRGQLSENGFALLLVSGVGSWMILEYLSSDSGSDLDWDSDVASEIVE